MIYLTGAVNALVGERPDVGLMMGYRPTGGSPGRKFLNDVAWAADNGCYSNPNLNVDRYLSWLSGLKEFQTTCLFATAPDVVGDCKATWLRSEPVLPQIRALGYAAALVAQDGIDDRSIQWDAFDCLFIGGSTEWKLSAEILPLVRQALSRGKWVHMGRVNSLRRLLRARFYGCQSTDGTFTAFGADKRLPQLERWLDFINAQPVLVGVHD